MNFPQSYALAEQWYDEKRQSRSPQQRDDDHGLTGIKQLYGN